MPRTPSYPQDPPPGHVWADGASRLTGRSIEQLYKDRQAQKQGSTNHGPKSVTLGARKAAWRIADIEAWLAEQGYVAPAPEHLHDGRPHEPRRSRRKRAARPAEAEDARPRAAA